MAVGYIFQQKSLAQAVAGHGLGTLGIDCKAAKGVIVITLVKSSPRARADFGLQSRYDEKQYWY